MPSCSAVFLSNSLNDLKGISQRQCPVFLKVQFCIISVTLIIINNLYVEAIPEIHGAEVDSGCRHGQETVDVGQI